MEGNSEDFDAVAREVLEELAGLGHRLSSKMHNVHRGENGVIHALACSDRPLTPSELSALGHLSSARVANVLRSLEEKGLVTREHSQLDRRRVTVTLTKAGRARDEKNRAEFEGLTSAFLAQLGQRDAQDMARILRRVNQVIDQNRAARAEQGAPDQERKGGQPHEDRQAL